MNVLRKKCGLDLETVTRPLTEQDYTDIFCTITFNERSTHKDWVYSGEDRDRRLSLFRRAITAIGESLSDALKEASTDRTFKMVRNAGMHIIPSYVA